MRRLGRVLERLGLILDRLGASWRRLGASWARLEASWARFEFNYVGRGPGSDQGCAGSQLCLAAGNIQRFTKTLEKLYLQEKLQKTE